MAAKTRNRLTSRARPIKISNQTSGKKEAGAMTGQEKLQRDVLSYLRSVGRPVKIRDIVAAVKDPSTYYVVIDMVDSSVITLTDDMCINLQPLQTADRGMIHT